MKPRIKKIAKQLINEQTYNKIVLPRHIAESVIANVRYGFPTKRSGMLIIGVTGTNGKTTTCNMLNAIFTASGKRTGLASSAVIKIGDVTEENRIHFTTAKGMMLQAMLSKMRKEKTEVIILEVASQALSQWRTLGVRFDAAVLTNITQDHLDFHGSMQKYAKAKAKLFKMAQSVCVLNQESDYLAPFEAASHGKRLFYYGKNSADTGLKSVSLSAKGSSFVVAGKYPDREFFMHLSGLFNVYNAMAAITLAREYGIDDDTIQKGLSSLTHVPGRMQAINKGQKFTVLVDHAHTEDALDNLFRAMKSIVKGKILLVIGCDGDRDPAKRQPIGKMSATYADKVYLTELENYTEEPAKIIAAVEKGILSVKDSERAPYVIIPDREKAIFLALNEAEDDDLVLIPGLGNQDTRGGPNGMEHWDDREVVVRCLEKLGHKK
jgi:UDP-N-acetylmuramoyl-L-alanyl-D-glutamate--2,6-diaminopimelate ligase